MIVLFRDFTFPLFQITKPEMAERARAGGFEHILYATWLCFTPVRQRIPCGSCSACRQLMEYGYTERMHPISHLRYQLYLYTRWMPDLRAAWLLCIFIRRCAGHFRAHCPRAASKAPGAQDRWNPPRLL